MAARLTCAAALQRRACALSSVAKSSSPLLRLPSVRSIHGSPSVGGSSCLYTAVGRQEARCRAARCGGRRQPQSSTSSGGGGEEERATPRRAPSTSILSAPVLGTVAALAVASGAVLIYMRFESKGDRARADAVPLVAGNPVVYLDVEDDERSVGRIVIQLRADLAPRAAENFRALCVGLKGWGYKTSPIHQVEKSRRVFLGDFFGAGGGSAAAGSASGGYSIYGESFRDEDLSSPALLHSGPGVVGMRNRGPDTNGSQFYITFRRLPELDGRCQVVGNVMEGWEVLEALDTAAGTSTGRFAGGNDYRVGACGELANYVPPAERAARAAAAAAASAAGKKGGPTAWEGEGGDGWSAEAVEAAVAAFDAADAKAERERKEALKRKQTGP